jgi:hypothetical protein
MPAARHVTTPVTVRRWSRLAAGGCLVVAAAFLGGIAYHWLTATAAGLRLELDLPEVLLTPTRRMACLALNLLPAAITTWGLLRLRSSFQCFARDELFSPRAIAGLRDFAATAAASVLVAAVMGPIMSLILTVGAPKGVNVAVNISTGSLTILLISGVTWIFAHVLGLGAAMAAENASLAEENAAFV